MVIYLHDNMLRLVYLPANAVTRRGAMLLVSTTLLYIRTAHKDEFYGIKIMMLILLQKWIFYFVYNAHT